MLATDLQVRPQRHGRRSGAGRVQQAQPDQLAGVVDWVAVRESPLLTVRGGVLTLLPRRCGRAARWSRVCCFIGQSARAGTRRCDLLRRGSCLIDIRQATGRLDCGVKISMVHKEKAHPHPVPLVASGRRRLTAGLLRRLHDHVEIDFNIRSAVCR